MTTKWQLISRGKASWCASGLDDGNSCSSSGGELHDYLQGAEDGTVVYDAQGADYDAFAELVVSGPMLDLRLGPDEIDRFSIKGKETLESMMPGLGGGFKTLAHMALVDGQKMFSSFDMVGLNVFLGMVREVPGIKVGKVVDHKVVWE